MHLCGNATYDGDVAVCEGSLPVVRVFFVTASRLVAQFNVFIPVCCTDRVTDPDWAWKGGFSFI